LDFKAAIGEQESFDEITIVGSPNIQSRIEGGVNGDIATSAITINTIPRILEARPGLKTMMDIAPVSFF
jgi:4-hydroxy-tetrahydrodipicolinate reductase